VNNIKATRREPREIKELAARRVEAVWACVNLLHPGLPLERRKALAEKFLDLEGEEPESDPIRINAAQVTEIVWRNSQCIHPHCPMLLFSDRIADELNEFFAAARSCDRDDY
jgi:hypothetical protein